MSIETNAKQSKQELRQAEQLFTEQRYADLVKHLAPQIFLFRSDPRYYYLLGIASLYTGDMSGAHSYLLRGIDLDSYNLDMQLGLAISHLFRKDEPQALRLLVDIQDKHPTNEKVIKALEMLKQAPEKVDWPGQIRLGNLRHLYPAPGFNWKKLFRRGAIALAGTAGLVIVGFFLSALVQLIVTRQAINRLAATPSSQSVSSVKPSGTATPGKRLDDRQFGVVPDSPPRFQLNNLEIQALVAEITSSFREYRDNRARSLLNRIMQSNAGSVIKEQMRGLASHLHEPGFVNFRDNYSPETILADPLVNSGVYVMWRGKIADVQKGQTAILFKLLVGYESSAVVRATVPVSLDFAAEVNDGDAIELIGQVLPDFTGGGFSLKGSALRLIRSN